MRLIPAAVKTYGAAETAIEVILGAAESIPANTFLPPAEWVPIPL